MDTRYESSDWLLFSALRYRPLSAIVDVFYNTAIHLTILPKLECGELNRLAHLGFTFQQ
jgi:hypothetical protein